MADQNRKIYEKFNAEVNWMIVHAEAASINANVDCIYPESFMIGILLSSPNKVSKGLKDSGINLQTLLNSFKEKLAAHRISNASESATIYENMKISKQIMDICQTAYSLSTNEKKENINLVHIFKSIIVNCPDIKKNLEEENININSLLLKIQKDDPEPADKNKTAPKKLRKKDDTQTTTLDGFCVNMTQMAADGKYDPIIAREEEIEEAITILCRRDKSNPILVGAAGVGKCLAKGTKVRMYDGSLKKVEDIEIGDQLMGVDSTPRNVLSLGNGTDDMFMVKQKKGENYIVNSEHILSLVNNKYGTTQFLEIAIKDWLKKPKTFQNAWKGWKVCVDYKTKETPIDPYMIGLWLGDGTACKSGVTNIDAEIVKYLEYFAFVNNYKIRQDKISYYFSNKATDIIDTIDDCGKLHAILAEYGLIDNKHIPHNYKYNSIATRLNVLAGLVDSDGYLIRNCYEIVQKNKSLAYDILELTRSLGFYCSIKEEIVKTQIHYRINICGRIDLIPCRIMQKRPKRINKNKNYLVTDIEVESVGKGEYFGFNIGGDGLFLLEDFTVTHNTAIIEGIAQRIISNTVPKKIQGCKIYALSISSLVAGTKYRGDFENRIQNLLKEIENDPQCILFIDEIHTIIGAGSAQGTLDASNILKPALAKNLKCIGATTNEEYKKYFDGESALERRFEKIDIDQPTPEQTKKILLGIKHKFEEFHQCVISDDAIDAIIDLTARYKPTRNFPDKAIDCMDYACAKYVWKENDVTPVITPNDVAIVISKQCKIPIEVILWSNFERIANIEKNLRQNIIGQDHVLESICNCLKTAYSGVRDKDRPIGTFVFGGESGTGKTYIAKQMSKAIDFNLIRLDMTEYAEEHSISKIIGSPPGYVGFRDVDVVTDKIKRRPYSLLLLDEIEKAHPNVLKLFLQVMSDGFITDAIGNKIDCRNLIIVMTGNFGLNDKKSGLGFGDLSASNEIKNEKKRLVTYCAQRFGEEFVNRIDEFIPFMHLNDAQLQGIAALRLVELIARIARKDCKISFSEDVLSMIVKKSKDEHGKNANILERIISQHIESKLADIILKIDQRKTHKYNININIAKDDFAINVKKTK